VDVSPSTASDDRQFRTTEPLAGRRTPRISRQWSSTNIRSLPCVCARSPCCRPSRLEISAGRQSFAAASVVRPTSWVFDHAGTLAVFDQVIQPGPSQRHRASDATDRPVRSEDGQGSDRALAAINRQYSLAVSPLRWSELPPGRTFKLRDWRAPAEVMRGGTRSRQDGSGLRSAGPSVKQDAILTAARLDSW